jgi:hypothetical protein
MIVHDIATSRAGDKGNMSQIAVIAREPRHYAVLVEKLTEAVVSSAFADIAHGEVTRHELPHLSSLMFLLENALGGGVSISLAPDPHGKSLSSLMLAIKLD